jgi:hypothetical protein
MIDLIKTFVVTFTQAIPRIQKIKTNQERRKLGTALFILYVRLNEATLAAHSIIGSLEVYVARMRKHLDHGNDVYALTAGHWIAGEVQHQITNFERLHELLYTNKELLQIVDAQSYNHLMPLLDRKFGALMTLLQIMGSGSLPLSPSAGDLEILAQFGRGDQSALGRAMRDLDPQWRENSLSITMQWGEEVYDKVVAYLQDRDPRQQLAEIEASLSSLREALVSNFSLADILLEVGDTRSESLYWL